jgi:hypothetical protein
MGKINKFRISGLRVGPMGRRPGTTRLKATGPCLGLAPGLTGWHGMTHFIFKRAGPRL